MDPIWLLVILILVVVFSSISIMGTLHRIRDVSEKTLDILTDSPILGPTQENES